MTDFHDYQKGQSGQGAPSYTSAAWRAGDSERQRKISEAAIKRSSVAQPTSGSQSVSAGNNYSESTSGFYTFFSIVVFVVACIFGVGEGIQYLPSNIQQQIDQYIGPQGLVSRNTSFWLLAVILVVVGVLTRKVLRWLVGFGILAGIVAFLIVTIYPT